MENLNLQKRNIESTKNIHYNIWMIKQVCFVAKIIINQWIIIIYLTIYPIFNLSYNLYYISKIRSITNRSTILIYCFFEGKRSTTSSYDWHCEVETTRNDLYTRARIAHNRTTTFHETRKAIDVLVTQTYRT